MKKNFLNIFLLFLIAFSTAGFAFAADITPTVDPKLLQEIASKTAQLNLVEKKGIVGIVSDASDTQLTITDTKGNTRFVDVDELTKFIHQLRLLLEYPISIKE